MLRGNNYKTLSVLTDEYVTLFGQTVPRNFIAIFTLYIIIFEIKLIYPHSVRSFCLLIYQHHGHGILLVVTTGLD